MRRIAASLTLALASACSSTPAPDAGPTPDGGVVTDAAVSDAGPVPPPTVMTSLGTVIGTRGNGFQAFLGIPYAEPPVGALRWRAPVARAPWTEPREATQAGAACAQNALGAGLGAEDCLFVNVHVPEPRPTNAPVLVWIHGGAFVFGEGLQTDRGTAGDLLAARSGLVVVSMNYRLGNFGWFTSAALGANGNQGFEDQQLALRWVRDNIAAFGGNPDDVTIAGESAGGLSVCLHLVAPGSRGLFHRAVSESGFCDSPLPTRAEHSATSDEIVRALGCDTAADLASCMRGKSMQEVRDVGALTGDLLGILARQSRSAWPDVDGAIVPADFRARVASGDVADVPVLLGWNRDEGTLFVGLVELDGTIVDEAAYRSTLAALASSNGLSTAQVEAQYPLASYPDPGAAAAAALGHASLACPSRRAAQRLTQAGRTVHAYHFTYPMAGFQIPMERALGAFHSAEIQFFFGHPAKLGERSFSGEQRTLYEAQSAYWVRFIRTGDPNGAGAPTWPVFALDSESSLALDRAITIEAHADQEPCALWMR